MRRVSDKFADAIKLLIKKYSKNRDEVVVRELSDDFYSLLSICKCHFDEDENILTSPKILAKFWSTLAVSLVFIAITILLIYFLIKLFPLFLNIFQLFQSSSPDGKLSTIVTILVPIATTTVGFLIGRKTRNRNKKTS